MYWLVRLGSIENRMDNQANIWVQGEEECAKKNELWFSPFLLIVAIFETSSLLILTRIIR